LALISKVRNVFGESATQDIATGSSPGAGSSGTQATSNSSIFSNGINNGAQTGSVIPASNTGNGGTIMPLVNDQPMEINGNGNDSEK